MQMACLKNKDRYWTEAIAIELVHHPQWMKWGYDILGVKHLRYENLISLLSQWVKV